MDRGLGTMRAMPAAAPPFEHRAFYGALAVSLALHLLALLLPQAEPQGARQASGPLQARLAPRPSPQAPVPEASPQSVPKSPGSQQKSREVLHVDRSSRSATRSVPTFSPSQKAEMDSFLNELSQEAQRRPPPTLAQRSLAMARQAGREMAKADEAGDALLEMRPNAPEPNPFSLELYLDGLVRRLNRSADFVNGKQRQLGIRTAAVQFRLNPDGSLKSFVVLNVADQADEIAYIRAIVERSVPFAAFPPDLDKAARSLGITICIRPGHGGDGAAGFSRMQGGRCQ